MKATCLLALLAAPALLLPLASAQDYPDVEVRPCPYPTWGHAVYINDAQATDCFTGPQDEQPDVEVHQCRPPTFGYVVVVNGRPYGRCMV